MIASFRDIDAKNVFEGKRSNRLPSTIHRSAMRKLWMLDAATELSDLRVPPGNRLEKLAGRRAGQHSIRINNQWRICFRWEGGNAYQVEIVDYH
ncbi:plasmid maintenance system killer [Candidatus Kaiserbacteria bacterium RIFCSPHIGHO2_02_FULL_59_21]|uniref:Plasmid maintenance system killer n=2 Tax=Candidatus Kaiseribacteriota TaxID=1752734 RepID=A0A0G1YWJ3_9BACT|nr:MAG: Plasmid maintenance system killer [Candidatus Kaiserbacteria bacterium GW2011_GWA2_58_9]OGG62850.1 MAG: plasmid maintenance system killer [Candidatus Kaiserbacteria bacterium RIFCSPHIGHO2_01_FULL_58_22]OGG67061.1 MAG: plasmid maintenance system killer [Candidatus Kaiserbacteria bacterium RIFCSPHIGHO2_02_FULL_59_21]OGG79481.1 MAG: plasmid maintenance system killer [Candidatus Kaiserbacteria bacterium RIFCSPLOWO2_01_FULL_59_34]OGG86825.1 MAG: plasmid maintenance system killer [Candidatus 